MKRLKRIISSALVFTVMASFAVFGTKASATNGLTDLITSDTDIDAILKTPYVDAVPTAFSELLLGIHTTGFGFAKDTLLRTGTSTNYDMQVEVKVNGDKISSPEGYYYPSHTALSADAEKKADEIRNIAPSCAVSATYSYGSNLPGFVTDGIINYANTPVNRWATWKSPNNSDTLTFSFDKKYDINNIDVHFFTDGAGTPFPSNVVIKYWNGTEYVEMPNITYPAIVNGGATAYTFDKVTTDKITVTCTRAASNKGMGITEVEIFGKAASDASEYVNVARSADVTSSIVPKYNSVQEINDGVIGFYSADNNRWNTYTGTGITKVSTVDFELATETVVDKIVVYPYDERAPYGTKDAMLVPQSITFQYIKDGVWTDIPNVSAPTEITPGTAATYTFPEIKASDIRATVTAYDGKTTGITELEIYGTPAVQNDAPYSVEINEDKFISTDNVVTSVVTVKNTGESEANIKLVTRNSRAVSSEFKDNYYAVLSVNGADASAGYFSKTVTLAPGESTEYISTLSFAKTEEQAKANAKAVTEDKDRLENHKASYLEWFKQNVPFFECDDPQITQTYYFRWLTYRNNIRLLSTDKYMISEFMPNVGWAGAYNSIVAPLSHHMAEGRWIKNGKYIDDYKDFWFETDGARVTGYVNSTADAYYADYLVNGDRDALIKHLDDLISVYNVWETNTSSDNAYFDADTGLYFVKNGYDGMEYSLSYKKGGSDVGCRPTVNAYMYGDAMAIAKIATLAGKPDIAEQYYNKAQTVKTAVEQLLWNGEDNMFEAYDLGEGDTLGIKEIIGYVPWYYNMPTDSDEFAKAWQYLTDESTFYGVYGPATADKSHPEYNTYYTDTSLGRSGGCNWDGSSWPFATAQTLTAAANALNNYQNAGLSADDYYKTLKAYTNGQFKNGYSWVGENRDADNSKWYIDHAHRSYHYNHSAYADLIITGLVGIRPADNDDTVVINPLVPENTLSSFVLENVEYRGNNLTVVYDKTGETYGVGKGLTVYVNGEVAKTADTVSKQTVLLATHEHDIVTVEAKAPTYTSAGWNEYEYCTSCDHTTFEEIEMLEVPSVSGDGTAATLAGDGARRVYWGYIGTENIEYKWFNDFKAQCGDTFTSEFDPKADDKYLLEKAGYYRFVVNYIDDNGKSVDRVFTFESGGQDVSVPAVTVDGNYAVIDTDGADVNKLYYGYIGETETAYAGFDRSVLTEADFSVKDGDTYLLNKAGYYRFVVNYKQGDRLVDKVYTVKVEQNGGVPDVTYADGKIKLSTNGVKVNKLYLAYNGEEAVEVTSWTDYCEKAIARACYLTPSDESEYTLANSGCYTVLVNYFDGNKNVDKYFTINN